MEAGHQGFIGPAIDPAPYVQIKPLNQTGRLELLTPLWPAASMLTLGIASAGLPFRETHHISGAAVKMAEDRGCQLSDLTPADLKTINDLFEDDVTDVWDFQRSAEMRDTEGGTSKRSVLQQAEKIKKYLADEGL